MKSSTYSNNIINKYILEKKYHIILFILGLYLILDVIITFIFYQNINHPTYIAINITTCILGLTIIGLYLLGYTKAGGLLLIIGGMAIYQSYNYWCGNLGVEYFMLVGALLIILINYDSQKYVLYIPILLLANFLLGNFILNYTHKDFILSNSEFGKSIIQLNLISSAILFFIGVYVFYVINKKNEKIIVNQSEQSKAYASKVEMDTIEKNKMLSIISHDLRGPLDNIKQTLILFENGILSEHETQVVSQKLNKKLDTTLDLMENILAWSNTRIKGEENKEIVELNSFLQEIIDMNEAYTESKQIALYLTCMGPQNILFKCFPNQIALIFRNLINNAIKFSKDGSNIIIQTNVKENNITIKVIDEGVGMDEQVMKRLFSNNVPIKKGVNGEPGFGVGLKMVKDFILKHDGNINCKSKTNEGTTFTITFPMSMNQ